MVVKYYVLQFSFMEILWKFSHAICGIFVQFMEFWLFRMEIKNLVETLDLAGRPGMVFSPQFTITLNCTTSLSYLYNWMKIFLKNTSRLPPTSCKLKDNVQFRIIISCREETMLD